MIRNALAVAAAVLPCMPGHAQPIHRDDPLYIVAPTPLPGLEQPADLFPANVQVHEAQPHAGRAFTRDAVARVPGIGFNEVQGNPFQPEILFRGFSVSPRLGAPQGLSVYLDGVRINEPFGDTLNWDLVPRRALQRMAVMPGSNPMFGLNALGGSLVLRTKSGLTHPGVGAEAVAGSFGHRALEIEAGGATATGWHGYAAVSAMREEGWRDFSPSRVATVFAKAGHNSGSSTVEVTTLFADTRLTGNGLTPSSLLSSRREAVFTRPDDTRHRLAMVTLNATRELSEANRVAITAYVRRLRGAGLNGDRDDDDDDDDEGGVEVAGVNHRTATRLGSAGLAAHRSGQIGAHRWSIGASYDSSRTRFRQSSEEGVLDETRAVRPTEPEELENALRASTSAAAFFATDTWSLTPRLHATFSARYGIAKIRMHDEGPTAPALDGRHRYEGIDPALGLAFQASPALTFFGGLSQGSRVPTAIELGCADPARPCTLPNALAADPPLAQVVARTVEAGMRGRSADSLRWSAAAFETRTRDDLLFVAANASAGYFANFGATRRRGIELAARFAAGEWRWHGSYAMVEASFGSPASVLAAGRILALEPGSPMPGVPRHTAKLGLEWESGGWRAAADVFAASSHRALGGAAAAGFATVDLQLARALGPWEVAFRVDNALDRDYATAALAREETYLAPAAPRSFSLVVKLRMR